MKKTNTLVIGQGIAGTMVAYMLHLNKIPCMVIDPGYANTSSRIAAGMFTPISGKRKTIHPMVLQQIPFAIKIYTEIGHLLGVSIIHPANIFQVSSSPAEQKEMDEKSANTGFAKFIRANPGILPGIKQEFGSFEINHAGWVDCELLISRFAQWLKENNAMIEAEFVYADLQVGDGLMEYHDMKFTHIVFCEGYRAMDNPFFPGEKIIPCKGDVLTIQYDNNIGERIIKKGGIYIVPVGVNRFKAGSTYQWNNNSPEPDEAGRRLIEASLDAMLENKYITIAHNAGVRPTTQNREVIARQHPEQAGMFMLNGLGTKGVLNGPWWAGKVVELILKS